MAPITAPTEGHSNVTNVNPMIKTHKPDTISWQDWLPLPAVTFDEWKEKRQLCRTNLYALCWVLGYKDVQPAVHGKIMSCIQHFKGGIDTAEPLDLGRRKINGWALKSDALIKGYRPFVPSLWDLEGPRNYLNMIPRGHLKSTVITCAHVIQWIINYPNVRILLFTHTNEKAEEFLDHIRNHFVQTAPFRRLFPEHCPQGGAVNSFGNTKHFNTCARTDWTEKERTVQFLTIDAAKAGGHYECVFIDDAVDGENVKTSERIETVKKSLADLEPLVDKRESASGGQRGWTYLTGTFYNSSDANFSVYEDEKDKMGPADYDRLMALPEPERSRESARWIAAGAKIARKQWALNVQSAAPNWPNGPYLWPQRYGYQVLKAIEDNPLAGPAALAAQYLMNPVPPGSGLIESRDQIVWTPRHYISSLYPRLSLHVAIDLAGMQPQSSARATSNDYTVLTLGGFGTDGHLYVVECHQGRPSPQQVIELMFSLYARHPRIQSFKIEAEAHARVLLPFLKAEMAKRQQWLPILEIDRDNQQSKQHKIRGLQPWFRQGMIHFADDLPCRTNIMLEILRFPTFSHDDILDTLCDLMTNRDGGITSEVTGRVADPASADLSKPLELKNPDGTITLIHRPVGCEPRLIQKLFALADESEVESLMGGW